MRALNEFSGKEKDINYLDDRVRVLLFRNRDLPSSKADSFIDLVVTRKNKQSENEGLGIEVGGNLEDGDTYIKAIIRESIEELSRVPFSFKQVGDFKCFNPTSKKTTNEFLFSAWVDPLQTPENMYPLDMNEDKHDIIILSRSQFESILDGKVTGVVLNGEENAVFPREFLTDNPHDLGKSEKEKYIELAKSAYENAEWEAKRDFLMFLFERSILDKKSDIFKQLENDDSILDTDEFFQKALVDISEKDFQKYYALFLNRKKTEPKYIEAGSEKDEKLFDKMLRSVLFAIDLPSISQDNVKEYAQIMRSVSPEIRTIIRRCRHFYRDSDRELLNLIVERKMHKESVSPSDRNFLKREVENWPTDKKIKFLDDNPDIRDEYRNSSDILFRSLVYDLLSDSFPEGLVSAIEKSFKSVMTNISANINAVQNTSQKDKFKAASACSLMGSVSSDVNNFMSTIMKESNADPENSRKVLEFLNDVKNNDNYHRLFQAFLDEKLKKDPDRGIQKDALLKLLLSIFLIPHSVLYRQEQEFSPNIFERNCHTPHFINPESVTQYIYKDSEGKVVYSSVFEPNEEIKEKLKDMILVEPLPDNMIRTFKTSKGYEMKVIVDTRTKSEISHFRKFLGGRVADDMYGAMITIVECDESLMKKEKRIMKTPNGYEKKEEIAAVWAIYDEVYGSKDGISQNNFKSTPLEGGRFESSSAGGSSDKAKFCKFDIFHKNNKERGMEIMVFSPGEDPMDNALTRKLQKKDDDYHYRMNRIYHTFLGYFLHSKA